MDNALAVLALMGVAFVVGLGAWVMLSPDVYRAGCAQWARLVVIAKAARSAWKLGKPPTP